jgi:thiol-disulfide isomerase/thioredoxin
LEFYQKIKASSNAGRKKENENMPGSGFASYDKDLIEKKSKYECSVVFVTSDRCSPCEAVTPTIKEYSKEFTDVQFLELYVDRRSAGSSAADKLEITSFPTFLIYSRGKEVKRFTGQSGVAEVKKTLKKLLSK